MSGLADLATLRRYMAENKDIAIDINTARAVAIASESTQLANLLERNEDGGEVRVCTAIDELIAESENKGIQALIDTCRLLKASSEVAKERLMEGFDLTEEEANLAIKKYWN